MRRNRSVSVVLNVPVTERTDTVIAIANYADKAVYHAKSAGKNIIFLLDHDDRKERPQTAEYVKIEF